MSEISYRITNVKEMPSLDPESVGKVNMLVTWIEDGARSYNLTIPEDKYSPEEARRQVEAEVKRHAALIGTEGKVTA